MTSNDTWEYLPLLNECIKILLTTALGGLMGYFQVLDSKTFLPQATRFVFHVALPLHILVGLGIGVNFYDDSFLWTFIAAFLVLRVFALIVSLGMVFFTKNGNGSILGQVAVMWLALTWISTIIMGVPIAGAVFGDPTKGRTYGILAAISSFIFQLPLQLFLFECHVLEKEYVTNLTRTRASVASTTDSNNDPEQPLPPLLNAKKEPLDMLEEEELEEVKQETDPPLPKLQEPEPAVIEQQQPTTVAQQPAVSFALWMEWLCTWAIWKKILLQLLSNPVLWGIIVGFFFSLTTIGPRFLMPTSDEYVPGLGWVFITAGWLGDCVSPVALITMGVWMQAQGNKLIRIPLLSAFLYMLSKLVLVPLVMVGLAKMVGLNNEAGRAAVLIAALPISMASFSLANKYQVGEAILSENVALGTALVLPTIIVWNLVMDALDLFPIA